VLVEDRQRALDAQKKELVEAHARELHTRTSELEAHARELEARTSELIEEMRAQQRELVEEMRAQQRELIESHQREVQTRDERERLRLRRATLEICEFLAIEVTTERRARMDAMTSEALDALRSAIQEARRWPEEL
jgi:hypothetical protein